MMVAVVGGQQVQVLALPDDLADCQCNYCVSQRRILIVNANCPQCHQHFSGATASWGGDGGRFQ